MSHTKEPWRSGGDGTIVYDQLGWGICNAVVFHGRPHVVPIENARRIVACVNACEGIPTDRLESLKVPLMKHLFGCDEHAANLVKQRDELLAAAEAIEINAEECLDFDECTAMLVQIDDYHKLMEAIASVKGSCVEQSAKNETQADLTLADETQTTAPAIVFYPAGSLGEEVDS